MKARWLVLLSLVLAGFAAYLLRPTPATHAPMAPPAPAPPLVPMPHAPPPPPPAVQPLRTLHAPAPEEPLTATAAEGPPLIPQSQIPSRSPAPSPPPPEWRRQQQLRAQEMLGRQLQFLEGDKEHALAAGDHARAEALSVRINRLRARKQAVDQELADAPAP